MTTRHDKGFKGLDEAALDALFHDSDRDDDVDANVNRAESSLALAADQALLAGLEQDTQTALELPEQISGAMAGCRFGLQHQSVGRPPENRNSSGANSSPRVPWTKASRQRSRLRPAVAICLIFAGVLSALPWGSWTGVTKTADIPWRQASFVPLSKSIEELRVGERVRSDNPDSAFENAPTAVDPPNWRKLRLMAATTWEDGTQDDIQIETLCPKTWLTDFDVRVGSSVPVPLDLVEMGLPAGLQAEVLSVEECPQISRGPGKVILTTVNHLNRELWELTLTNGDGTSETVRPTAPHKFYSATRSGWFSASELKVGEEIASASGRSLVVAATRQVVGVQRVYNMTVEGEHVYYVSRLGALVHNQDCVPSVPGQRPPSLTPEGGKRQAALNEAKRRNGVPTSKQPDRTLPNTDRRGNVQPGRVYEYDVPAEGGGTKVVRIRDDSHGDNYGPNDPQNRGPHFNDQNGNHFDYER